DVAAQLNAIYGSGTYSTSTLDGGPTSDTVGLVFDTNTVELIGQKAIGTASSTGQPRQALRYELHIIGESSSDDFYLYVSHYKSGSADTDAAPRNVEAQAIRADSDSLGKGRKSIYAGDFNLQNSSEAEY